MKANGLLTPKVVQSNQDERDKTVNGTTTFHPGRYRMQRQPGPTGVECRHEATSTPINQNAPGNHSKELTRVVIADEESKVTDPAGVTA